MLRKSFLIASLFPLACFGIEKHFAVETSNPSSSSRMNVPVVVGLKSLEGLDFTVKSASLYDGDTEQICQIDDINDDGIYDEVCFLCNMAPHSSKTFDLVLSDQQKDTSFKSLVYADMMLDDKKGKHPLITRLEAPGESYLFSDLYHHGVAFESEINAYRIYFDHRQNIDIYGKRHRRLELQDTEFYTTPAQMSEGYGNDVLWAGSSIGCGSLKLWDGKSVKDWTDVRKRGQRIISVGPLRTVVEMFDKGVNTGQGGIYDVRTVYTQYAGHRDIQVDVYLSRIINEPFLCTGVQKIGATKEVEMYNGGIKHEGFVHSDGLACSWGSDYPEMGKKEQFPPETVGLSVYVPERYIVSTLTDDLNYLILIGKRGQNHIRYYISFCADKEEEGYHSAKEWFESSESWRQIIEAE